MGQFITYAQNNEDVILNAYFKDVAKGTYVDIGANHPINDSVTKHFYMHGWRGINVEPIKNLYEQLKNDRPEDINLRIGVSDKPGTLMLREYANDGLSTFSRELQNAYNKTPQEKTATYQDIEVPVITLKELFTEHKLAHIHFMKVDVEGFEYEVLRGNDWKKYRPEMLCIEANHDIPDKDWRTILDKHNYEKVWNDGLNDYYLAQESAQREGNFSYAEAMLLSDQILPHHVINYIRNIEGQLRDEQVKLDVQAIRFKQLKQEKIAAEKKIAEQRRFKQALKLLIKSVDNVISARIERLHRTKVTSNFKLNPVAQTAFDGSSKEKLLSNLRTSDLQTYYSTEYRRIRPSKFYTYRILKSTYGLGRRTIRKGARLGKSLIKRGKHDEE